MKTFTCTIFALTALLAVAQTDARPDVLRSAADVEAFFRGQPTPPTPFRIRGVVQILFPDMAHPSVALKDMCGERMLVSVEVAKLGLGDEVVLSGIARTLEENEQALVVTNAVRVGTGTVDPPLELALGDIDERRHHLCRLSTTGTVVELRRDEIDPTFRYLILQEGAHVLPAFAQDGISLPEDPKLLGATVRVFGQYARTLPTGRRFGDPFISISRLDVLSPAPDPFNAPRLVASFYQSPQELSQAGRRTVSGRVLACWGGDRFLLRTPDNYLVGIETTDAAPQPPFGAAVTVSGFPETDRYHLFLVRAVYRTDSVCGTVRADEPQAHSLGDIMPLQNGRRTFNNTLHGKTAVLTGVLKSVSQPDSPERHAYVECEGVLLTVDFSSVPDAFRGIEAGSTVRVSGCCILQAENRIVTSIYPALTDFTLVLRQPSDITVISRTPWWTPGKLLIVIGVLLAALGALQLRNRILKRLGKLKVAERTRLAVELHDSLSQSLAGLACQIAAAEDAARDDPSAVRDKLATADRMLQSCRTELRQCLFDLRSDTLSEPDFATAVRRTIEHLTPFASISLRFNVPRARLADTVAHATLAIVRELVTNAVRHATADSVRIAGTVDGDRLRFSVTDDGCGFDPSRCDGIAEGHFGLNGIRERVKSLNGTLDIRSTPGKGTRVAVTLPLTTP